MEPHCFTILLNIRTSGLQGAWRWLNNSVCVVAL